MIRLVIAARYVYCLSLLTLETLLSGSGSCWLNARVLSSTFAFARGAFGFAPGFLFPVGVCFAVMA